MIPTKTSGARVCLVLGSVLVINLSQACGEEPSAFVEKAAEALEETDLAPEAESSDAQVYDAPEYPPEKVSDSNSKPEDWKRPPQASYPSDEQVSGVDRPDYGAEPPPEEELVENVKSLPKFGLLVNDLECGLCHVSVLGNVASTRDVPALWPNSNVEVEGSWWVADLFQADQAEGVQVSTKGPIVENYIGEHLPLDTNEDGHSDFPQLDFNSLPGKMRGELSLSGNSILSVNKIHEGNLILIGTKQNPIIIKDDIWVNGDLVIKGYYEGIGTIYVTGNIYIPSDLKAKSTAFPFAQDQTQALMQAESLMQNSNTDALALASARSIFIADLGKKQNTYSDLADKTIYNFHVTPENRQAEALGVYDIYNWFPGGEAAYSALYENALDCNNKPTRIGSFNMVEAFLYARNTVAGISRQASYSIRGGLIADYFHIVSGASLCSPKQNSLAHGKAMNRSYIEYDYRIQTGKLRILEYIGALFPKNE